MQTTKKLPIVVLLSLALLSASCGKNSASETAQCQLPSLTHAGVTVGAATLSAALAEHPAEQEQGLSNCTELRDREAMLFDFTSEPPTKKTFWMKDMRMPLDFIWVARGAVVGVTENVAAPAPGTPDSSLPKVLSPADSDTVIELSVGSIKKYNIKVGDKVVR
jgi:uncharacterized membrane protein (UPF0127 family)